MKAYIYQADIYCEKCGRDICRQLRKAGLAPPDPMDSDDFPKGPYPDGGGEADTPQHCGSGAECLDGLELPNGGKVGAFLENDLTADGVEYVREAERDGGEVAAMWGEFYRRAGYEI